MIGSGSRPRRRASALFYRSDDYVANVTQARLVTLASFWLAIAATWAIAGGRRDPLLTLLG